jgi:plasmid stabilization system protein ParE
VALAPPGDKGGRRRETKCEWRKRHESHREVLYRVGADTVDVVRVVHGSRELGKLI